MGHKSTPADQQPSLQLAEPVAATMHGLATPSRVRILLVLRQSAQTVSALADAVGMEQSAVSHQLRLLRNLGLIVGHREGQCIRYSLHDDHIASLLDEAISHAEHVRLGLANPAPTTPN